MIVEVIARHRGEGATTAGIIEAESFDAAVRLIYANKIRYRSITRRGTENRWYVTGVTEHCREYTFPVWCKKATAAQLAARKAPTTA